MTNSHCRICNATATRTRYRQELCDRHYRLRQMRYKAKADGVYSPSMIELEQLVDGCGMVCPACGVNMDWTGGDGRKKQVTLQHNRDGTIQLLCLSCNSRHQHFDGDSFYVWDHTKKKCILCGIIHDKSQFWKNRSNPDGLQSYCKQCKLDRDKLYHLEHREQCNAMRRRYYHRRIEEGNPIPRGET